MLKSKDGNFFVNDWSGNRNAIEFFEFGMWISPKFKLLLIKEFESSKESIIMIDNYADKKLLDLLSKTKKKIVVYSKNINEELINKYQSQYDNVKIIENSSFHDRFIIIDNKELYHCGASFKELGKKCFAINKVGDSEILDNLLNLLQN